MTMKVFRLLRKTNNNENTKSAVELEENVYDADANEVDGEEEEEDACYVMAQLNPYDHVTRNQLNRRGGRRNTIRRRPPKKYGGKRMRKKK